MTTPSAPHDTGPEQPSALRLLIIDDSRLFREGLATLLRAAGLDVVAEFGHAEHVLDAIDALHPDLILMDARMPPTHTDEGIHAALLIRSERPDVGVIVLTTYAEGTWANQLLAAGSAGLGYLLKDRVDDVAELVEAVRRVSKMGTAIDPEVIERLVAITNHHSALDALTKRELDVLSLMAQGKSNVGIGTSLHVSARTVEAYIASIFSKLPLDARDSATNRRVLFVLTYLQEQHLEGSPDRK